MNDLISRKALIAEYDRVHIGKPGKARKLMEDAPAVREWIPVSERLPRSGELVMVFDVRDGGTGLWEFSGEAWYDARYKPWGIYAVTHWMPLPEPPKGD